MYVFIVLVMCRVTDRVAGCWEISAHLAYEYKYIVFPSWFLEWEFFLIAPFSDHCPHCLLVTFSSKPSNVGPT